MASNKNSNDKVSYIEDRFFALIDANKDVDTPKEITFDEMREILSLFTSTKFQERVEKSTYDSCYREIYNILKPNGQYSILSLRQLYNLKEIVREGLMSYNERDDLDLQQEENERSLTDEEIEDILSVLKPEFTAKKISTKIENGKREYIDYTTPISENVQYMLPKQLLDELYDRIKDELTIQFRNVKVIDEDIDIIKERLYQAYLMAKADTGKNVGIIAAQSLGERLTQSTLRSVDWEEKIFIRDMKTNEIKIIKIGELIDNIIEETPIDSDLYSEEQEDVIMIKTKPDESITTLSVDENGKIFWKTIEAFTRHPIINKDGSKNLLKVKTHTGRSVIATKGKSFLVRKNNKLVPINGSDLSIGDCLPVMRNIIIPKEEQQKILDISIYLEKDKYLFGTEIYKAKEIRDKEFAQGNRYWWKHNIGVNFVLPYTKSDSAMDILKETPRKGFYSKQVILKGYVYPKKCTRTISKIPEIIDLDYDFGFFLGAYLAEGMSLTTDVIISNKDENFQEMIYKLCRKWEIGYHVTKNVNGYGIDIIIHSVVLASLMNKMCNTGSKNKVIPNWCYIANDNFVKGLLNAYFSGDGCVTKTGNIICTSVSEKLMDGIMILLSRFGIMSKKSRHIFKSKQHGYSVTISNGYAIIFVNEIGSIIKYKQDRLNNIKLMKFRRIGGNFDIIPGINIDGEDLLVHREDIPIILKLLEMKSTDEGDGLYNLFKNAYDSEVLFDQVIEIKEVTSSHEFVYDLTVEDTRTFALANGIMCYDTFYLAGVASGRAVVEGLARLLELLNITKNPKNPTTTIHMKEKQDPTSLRNYIPELQFTKISDLIKDDDTLIAKAEIKKGDGGIPNEPWHDIFEFLFDVNKDDEENYIKRPNWILRFKMNREEMFSRKITMKQVADIIESNSQGLRVVYSDLSIGVMDIYCDDRVIATNLPQVDYINQNPLKYHLRDNVLPQIKDMVICGIPNITRLFPSSIKLKTFIKDVIHIEFEDDSMFYLKVIIDLHQMMKMGVSITEMQSFIDSRLPKYITINKTIDNEETDINNFGIIITSKRHISPKNLKKLLESISSITMRDLFKNHLVKDPNIKLKTLSLFFEDNIIQKTGIDLDELSRTLTDYFYRRLNKNKVSSINLFNLKTVITPTQIDISNFPINPIHLLEDSFFDLTITTPKLEIEGEHWFYETEGNNLLDIFALPDVEFISTVSNDPNEIYEVLGIEAVRACIFEELEKNGGESVDKRHIGVLVDMMTHTGEPTSVSRYGLAKQGVDFLALAGNEETTSNLLTAGAFGLMDNLNGATGNIFVGNLAKLGTNTSDVVMDKDLENKYLPAITKERTKWGKSSKVVLSKKYGKQSSKTNSKSTQIYRSKSETVAKAVVLPKIQNKYQDDD